MVLRNISMPRTLPVTRSHSPALQSIPNEAPPLRPPEIFEVRAQLSCQEFGDLVFEPLPLALLKGKLFGIRAYPEVACSSRGMRKEAN